MVQDATGCYMPNPNDLGLGMAPGARPGKEEYQNIPATAVLNRKVALTHCLFGIKFNGNASPGACGIAEIRTQPAPEVPALQNAALETPQDFADAAPDENKHAGSASPHLTGRGVLFSWLLSIIFHIAALGVMYQLVFPYVAAPHEVEHAVTFAQVVGDIDAKGTAPIPPNSAPPEEFPTPATTNTATLDTVRSPSPTALNPSTGGALVMAGDLLSEVTGGLGGPSMPGIPVIGLGSGSAGSGGDSGPPGVSIGGGGGVNFFGLQSSAPGVRSIVFVVDRSASMMETFEAVRQELRRSIGALRRSQKFHVIFYNSGEPIENPPMKLVSAIDANKRAFYDFLDTISPNLGTRPERALRQALALEPDLIYFLSDGAFEPEVAERLKEWNRGGRTKIYTIAYLDPEGRHLLEAIARQHGGEFKFVSEHDIP